MPEIFDNIKNSLIDSIREAMKVAERSDFCVGYFNLRGWKLIDSYVEKWSGGEGHCCRLLVGMQKQSKEQLKSFLKHDIDSEVITQGDLPGLKQKLAEEFRNQLVIGVPSNEDEAGLRRLADQIQQKKLVVKLFLRHPLHAKLYLLSRNDIMNPKIGYLGSSNLTLAGLSQQGELNVDVRDHDAWDKLAAWFEDRWNDRFCIDISNDLVEIINQSWARPDLVPPYLIYIKMAYHLSREARSGLTEFNIPAEMKDTLFEFQSAAVKIAAHHLNKRGGVLIGDVVGLGKTLIATTLAKIFEEDYGFETLIICPKNLENMWRGYTYKYRLHADVLPISQVQNKLKGYKRYRMVIVDESQNLRNRQGVRFQCITDYIAANDSKVILLSATPYNKSYLDLSSQLRLFIDEQKDLGIRPERLLREIGETEFIRRYQCPKRSLAAFEKSLYPEDWRELMRLYMVRRTRSFIQENYAIYDHEKDAYYLVFPGGERSYFPKRIPKIIKFEIKDSNPDDTYARLYSDIVVDTISSLRLPRYGLGHYLVDSNKYAPTPDERKVIDDLSRAAGPQLKGFCRTNLFKRLESSGASFLLSLKRHALRNHVYIFAIENSLPIPIGAQNADLLEVANEDEDDDFELGFICEESTIGKNQADIKSLGGLEADLKAEASQIYNQYFKKSSKRFKWISSKAFKRTLLKDLKEDTRSILQVLNDAGEWLPEKDAKLKELFRLLNDAHPHEKVLVFSQFADTVDYLLSQLRSKGIESIEKVTGSSADPTDIAERFSPISNQKTLNQEDELRIVLATDVLSEGQNLQDCSKIVNYDLPWAIIRLIQRAGRVDRIGQKSDRILCYTFLPADGVEGILRLKARVQKRLEENAEVVGTDEQFFEGAGDTTYLKDLFTEKAGILDNEKDSEVDLGSYAYQIWKNAIDAHPELEDQIAKIPDVVYATKDYTPTKEYPEGTLVFLETQDSTDTLAWIDTELRSVTESQFAILKAAECHYDTPPIQRHHNHHVMVSKGIELISEIDSRVGGQLGRPSGARFRTYELLKQYYEENKNTLFDQKDLRDTIADIYNYPLRQTATDTLNRQLKIGLDRQALVDLVITLRKESRLCLVTEEYKSHEPRIICSMGIRDSSNRGK
jgi:hypothetical protein